MNIVSPLFPISMLAYKFVMKAVAISEVYLASFGIYT